MSEAKFTKGPWVTNGFSCVNAGDQTLCAMVNSSIATGDPTEDYANASLIATSPEMYEMLNEISESLLEAGGYGNYALAKRIELLLAKARGEK